MNELQNISDLQLYMILVEIEAVSEDGTFVDEDVEDEYIDLVSILQHEFVKRGYKNEQAVIDKFGYIYQPDIGRRYH